MKVMSMRLATFLFCLFAAGIAAFRFFPVAASDQGVVAPVPAVDEQTHTSQSETAVFAGGCFWGVQGVFQHVKGITSAISGYSGGDKSTAKYETVSTGTTGHAESVQITYDPGIVTYGKLLQVYFSVVTDPTTLNRQGPDHGTQYRSAIFFQNSEQKKIAQDYIEQLQQAGTFGRPVVTSIEPFDAFYPAEQYHQNFLALNPSYPYIVANDMPKIENLKRLFPSEYRDQPILVSALAN
jgi:peptide-methionine (S)-S-oxide reductase